MKDVINKGSRQAFEDFGPEKLIKTVLILCEQLKKNYFWNTLGSYERQSIACDGGQLPCGAAAGGVSLACGSAAYGHYHFEIRTYQVTDTEVVFSFVCTP